MNEIATLEAVRDVAVAKLQEGFVRGQFASDKGGRLVEPTSKEACGWCLSGALMAALSEVGQREDFLLDDFKGAPRAAHYGHYNIERPNLEGPVLDELYDQWYLDNWQILKPYEQNGVPVSFCRFSDLSEHAEQVVATLKNINFTQPAPTKGAGK